MPSPFPGMDPFIESQKWRDFHHSVITQIRDHLLQQVRPRYVTDIEENGDLRRIIAPDVSVVQKDGWLATTDGGIAVAAEPVILTLPQIDLVEEA